TTANHGFRRGEKITISGVSNSSFNGDFYVASVPSSTTFTVAQNGADATSGGGTAKTQYLGGCVTGGCFYSSTAFTHKYRGNFFFGDLNSGQIMRVQLNGSNEVDQVDVFATGFDQYIDCAVGPDGALYYAVHSGTIYRLAYNGSATQSFDVTPTSLNFGEG